MEYKMIDLAMQTFNDAQKKRKKGCLFCDPYNGMIVKSTTHFNVLADTFPIVAGHTMVSSKGHFGCAGEIPPELQEELFAIKNDIADTFQKEYGKVIFYEHGRAGCCLTQDPEGSKCEHFHLHALPADVDIAPQLAQKFSHVQLRSFNDVYEQYYSNGNYLYFENNKGEIYFYPTSEYNVESHHLRTLICQELDILERSNWEEYKDSHLWLQSISTITKLVA